VPAGKNIVKTTGEQTLSAATKVATDWYLDLRNRIRKGEHLHGRSFESMADAFIAHADQVREVSEGQREQYRIKWNLLKPHFDGVKVSDVDTRFLLALREKLSLRRPRPARSSSRAQTLFYATALDTGTRKGELGGLRWVKVGLD
jgi:hypothetical protein